MKSGNFPKPPRCALAPFINQPYFAYNVRWRLYRHSRYFFVDLNDPDLPEPIALKLITLADKIYPKERA